MARNRGMEREREMRGARAQTSASMGETWSGRWSEPRADEIQSDSPGRPRGERIVADASTTTQHNTLKRFQAPAAPQTEKNPLSEVFTPPSVRWLYLDDSLCTRARAE